MIMGKLSLQMEINMKESFRTIKYKDKVFISGPMVKFIKVVGNSLRCMGKEHIFLLMGQNTMVFIIWEKDMAKE